MSSSTEKSLWKFLEDSSQSTMMKLTIQLLCKVSVVLGILKSLDNDIIKIRLEVWNVLVDLFFLTYDSVITTCTLKSPVFTPTTLVYLGMGVQI